MSKASGPPPCSAGAGGFFTPEQLAQRLPVGYRDTRNVTPLAELRAGMETAFEGIVAPQARLCGWEGRAM